jgi:hypothetical protein
MDEAPESPAHEEPSEWKRLSGALKNPDGTLSYSWDIDGFVCRQSALDVITALGEVSGWRLNTQFHMKGADIPTGLQITSHPYNLSLVWSGPFLENLTDRLDALKVIVCKALRDTATSALFLEPSKIGGMLKRPGLRDVSPQHLHRALTQAMQSPVAANFSLAIFRLGQKLNLSEDDLWSKLVGRLRTHCDRKTGWVDLGCEIGIDQGPDPWVAGVNHNWYEVGNRACTFQYPMFPALLDGVSGGVTFTKVVFDEVHDAEGDSMRMRPARRDDPSIQVFDRIKVYSLHQHRLDDLHSQCQLETSASTSRWWFNKKQTALLHTFNDLALPRPGSGLRLEIRVRLEQVGRQWPTVERDLDMVAAAVCRMIGYKSVPMPLIRASIRQALEAATIHRLWDVVGEAGTNLAPLWKCRDYWRILSRFGWSHKKWARNVVSLERSDAPFGPPVQPMHVGMPGEPVAAVGPEGIPPESRTMEECLFLNPAAWDDVEIDDADLSLVERDIKDYLTAGRYLMGPSRCKGRRMYCVQYQTPRFGKLGSRLPRSAGYISINVLARCICLWAGADWRLRCKDANRLA